jgi:hypothetical protein
LIIPFHRDQDFKDCIRTFGLEAFVIDFQGIGFGHLVAVFLQPHAKDVFIALIHITLLDNEIIVKWDLQIAITLTQELLTKALGGGLRALS